MQANQETVSDVNLKIMKYPTFFYSAAHQVVSTDRNQCAGCDQFTAMEEISLQMAESLLSRVDSEGMPVVWHNTDLQRS